MPPDISEHVKSRAIVSPNVAGWALAGLLVMAHGVALWLFIVGGYEAQIVWVLIEGIIYTCAAYLVTSGRMTVSIGTILAVAFLLRIGLVFLAPYHSSDVFRYIWDGRVQGAGVNPYLYVPNDPILSGLRDSSIWPNINRADYAHTIYPPAAQIIYFLTTRISDSVTWMKAVLVLFESGAIVLLIRLLDFEKLPRQRILLYAWCPLPIWEFAGGGHVDAAMIAFSVGALLLRRRGADIAAGAAIGLAIVVKFFPLVLLPALWRRWQWRLLLSCLIVIALSYLIYSSAGSKVLGFLPGYVDEEGIGDASGFWLASMFTRMTDIDVPATAYFSLIIVVMAVLALRTQLSPVDSNRIYVDCLWLATVSMVSLSPAYPWYFCWLVPFLCFVPSLSVYWLTGTAILLDWDSKADFPWTTDLVYTGVIVAAAIDIGRHLWIQRRILRIA